MGFQSFTGIWRILKKAIVESALSAIIELGYGSLAEYDPIGYFSLRQLIFKFSKVHSGYLRGS